MDKVTMSLDDSTKLRKLITENPDLPLLAFVGETAYIGDFTYNSAGINSAEIDEVALFDDCYVCGRDEYEDRLFDRMADTEEFKELSEEEMQKKIDEMMDKVDFQKAIIFYVDN